MDPKDLLSTLRSQSRKKHFPDQSSYDSLSLEDLSALSESTGWPLREVEILALQNALMPERYSRNAHSFSPKEQAQLLQSSVCVVGLGGLGGHVVEFLARAGVGKLILVDGDVFEESNLNRQLLSTTKTLGKSKVQAAKTRIAEVNPSVEVLCFESNLGVSSCEEALPQARVVVDCLDNLKTRFLVQKKCQELDLPMVFGAVAGYYGQVMTILPGDEGLSKIYGAEEGLPEKGIETKTGNLAPCVGVIAAMESSETLKILLNKGTLLRNRLLFINLLDVVFGTIDL